MVCMDSGDDEGVVQEARSKLLTLSWQRRQQRRCTSKKHIASIGMQDKTWPTIFDEAHILEGANTLDEAHAREGANTR